jgi:3-hydroxyisobutyrate dehydrogenase-like beta-hydroxyacid dehydrogenase
VQQVADVVQAYASPVLPTGELGSALAVKLVNNLLFAAHAQLAVQAVALAGQLGVDGPLLLRTIAACSGNSTAATTLATLPDAARFEELAGPYLRKDVAACVEELEALGVGAGLLADVVRDGPLDLTR